MVVTISGHLKVYSSLQNQSGVCCISFFSEKCTASYFKELNITYNVATKNSAGSLISFREIPESCKLKSDLNLFAKIRYALNKNFQFWNQFLCMMDVYDLLRADRDGIGGLHFDAVLRSVYLCAAFDSSKYLRWCSIYHDLP